MRRTSCTFGPIGKEARPTHHSARIPSAPGNVAVMLLMPTSN